MKNYTQFINEVYRPKPEFVLTDVLMDIISKNINETRMKKFFDLVLKKYYRFEKLQDKMSTLDVTKKVLSIFQMVMTNKTIYKEIKEILIKGITDEDDKDRKIRNRISLSKDAIWEDNISNYFHFLDDNDLLSIEDIERFIIIVYEADLKTWKDESAIERYLNKETSYRVKKSDVTIEQDRKGIDFLDKTTAFQVKSTPLDFINENEFTFSPFLVFKKKKDEYYGYMKIDKYFWIFIDSKNLDRFYMFDNKDIISTDNRHAILKPNSIKIYTGLSSYIRSVTDENLFPEYRDFFPEDVIENSIKKGI